MSPDPPAAVFAAMRQPGFLRGLWPWRALGHLVGTPMIAAVAAVPLAGLALPWVGALSQLRGTGSVSTVAVLVAAGCVAVAGGLPPVALALAGLERRRLRLVDLRPLADGHRPVPGPGLGSWGRARYPEVATWKAVGYALLFVSVMPLTAIGALALAAAPPFLLVLPLIVANSTGPVSIGFGTVSDLGDTPVPVLVGLLLLPAVPYLIGAVAGLHAGLARALLGATTGVRAELKQVSRSRARLVDAFEAERRRIERDLHDGAQERLVSLTLRLGMARLDVPPTSAAHQNVAEAHTQAKELMEELRELVRGIHPRVLTDRGLAAALGELADRCPIPVTLDAELPTRLPDAAEATAYFVVAEALTNVTRHSGAATASVSAWCRTGLLTIRVSDDGDGGADPARGSGLTGLADRAAVLDGRVSLSSPPGGPTVLQLEIPCER